MSLKPCPFCGSTGAWVAISEDDCGRNKAFTVECGNMSCGAEIGWHPRESDAVEKWNQRVDKYQDFFELTVFLDELESIEQWMFGIWVPGQLSPQNYNADSELAACQASIYRKIRDIRVELIDG